MTKCRKSCEDIYETIPLFSQSDPCLSTFKSTQYQAKGTPVPWDPVPSTSRGPMLSWEKWPSACTLGKKTKTQPTLKIHCPASPEQGFRRSPGTESSEAPDFRRQIRALDSGRCRNFLKKWRWLFLSSRFCTTKVGELILPPCALPIPPMYAGWPQADVTTVRASVLVLKVNLRRYCYF